MSTLPFSEATLRHARRIAETEPPGDCDPKVEALVNDLIGRVADKWTMIILEVLDEHGRQRFTQISRRVSGISQKMLTRPCGRWSATAWSPARCTPWCRRASITS